MSVTVSYRIYTVRFVWYSSKHTDSNVTIGAVVSRLLACLLAVFVGVKVKVKVKAVYSS